MSSSGVSHFLLLTAVLANAQSRVYYARIKGEVEERVRAEGFARASFFRPSMLVTPTNRYGFTQGLALAGFPFIDPLLVGPLSRFRSIKVSDLGKAMVRHAERPGAGVEVLEWREFQAVLSWKGGLMPCSLPLSIAIPLGLLLAFLLFRYLRRVAVEPEPLTEVYQAIGGRLP